MPKRARRPSVDLRGLAELVDGWLAEGRPNQEIEARVGRGGVERDDWAPLWPQGLRPGDLGLRAAPRPSRHVDYTLRDGSRVTWDVEGKRVAAAVVKTRLEDCEVDLGGGLTARVVRSEERPVEPACGTTTQAALAREAVFVRKKTRVSWEVAAGWRADVTAVREGPTANRMESGVGVEVEWCGGGAGGAGLTEALGELAARLGSAAAVGRREQP